MIVLVPYVRDMLKPETVSSVIDTLTPSIHPQFAELDGDEGYYFTLRGFWKRAIHRQEDLCIVEQDHVLHDAVFLGFQECEFGTWCTFPYSIGRPELCERGLGCARFRWALMAQNPDLIEVACLNTVDGYEPKRWDHMDVRIWRELTRRGYGLCVHAEPVGHLHEYEGGRVGTVT